MVKKDNKDATRNLSTYLVQFIGRPAYLATRGDYFELSIQNPDRADEFELTSQANMESSLYKIIDVHDDFVLLLEATPPERALAVPYLFLKKVQVII
jgi:hypothetical protein